MTEANIENLAEQLLVKHHQRKVPVDVRAIAAREGIHLLEGDFDSDFTGELDFYPHDQSYALYVPRVSNPRFERRVRFTIAHELAHAVLPSHIPSFQRWIHDPAQPPFESNKRTEREADVFAAALLIPRLHLRNTLDNPREKQHLGRIVELARNCHASEEAVAFRITRSTTNRQCAIVSEDKLIRYWFASNAAGSLRFALAKGIEIPFDGPTYKAATASGPKIRRGNVAGEMWFAGNRVPPHLHEEAKSLGKNRVLTILSWVS